MAILWGILWALIILLVLAGLFLLFSRGMSLQKVKGSGISKWVIRLLLLLLLGIALWWLWEPISSTVTAWRHGDKESGGVTQIEPKGSFPMSRSTPTAPLGSWSIIATAGSLSDVICPPRDPSVVGADGVYTRLTREDSTAGITLFVEKTDGSIVRIVHPQGEENHLAVGSFLCIAMQANKTTQVTIEISNSPLT